VNKKRTHRIYREEGLSVRTKVRKKRGYRMVLSALRTVAFRPPCAAALRRRARVPGIERVRMPRSRGLRERNRLPARLQPRPGLRHPARGHRAHRHRKGRHHHRLEIREEVRQDPGPPRVGPGARRCPRRARPAPVRLQARPAHPLRHPGHVRGHRGVAGARGGAGVGERRLRPGRTGGRGGPGGHGLGRQDGAPGHQRAHLRRQGAGRGRRTVMGPPARLSAEEVARVRELRADGRSLRQIAVALKVPLATIARAARACHKGAA